MSGGIVGVATPDPGTNALIQRLANPPNPLEQAGQSVNALTAVKEFAAQNALTGIYQQSIDPQTGQVDLGKFNALASQNPAALWKFGQTMQSAGTGVGNEGQGSSAQLNAKLDQLGAQAAYMTPLLAKAQAGTVTADDVRSVLKDIPPGVIPPSTLASVNQQLDNGADPNNVVRGAFFANQHGRDILNTALGPVATVNQGPQTTFVRPAAPFAPGGVSSPPLPMALSPESIAKVRAWESEPYDWTDANNVEHKGGTKGDYLRSRGINPETYFTNNTVPPPGSPPPSVTGPVSTVTTGRTAVPAPTAAAPGGAPAPSPAAPGAPAAAPTSSAPGAPTPLAPPPGPPTAAIPAGSAAASQKAYSDAQDLQRTLPERINPLINALSVLRAYPDLQTAGVETLNDVKQKLAAYGVNVPNMTGANAYQELAKYLAQYTRGIPGANRSDLAALDAAAATPHMAQGPQVIQTLTAKLVGSERLRAAGVDQFNSQYSNPTEASKNSAQFLSKTSTWASTQDPQAYGMDEMTPQEIADYYKGLSPAAKKRFEDSARDAYRLKGITPGATLGRPATPPPTPAPTTAPAPAPPPAPATPGYMTPNQMYGGSSP